MAENVSEDIHEVAIDALMRKINDTIGEDTLKRLYRSLTEDEYWMLRSLMQAGDLDLHGDGYIGFTSGTSNESFYDESINHHTCSKK